ncbi:SAM-dependent methyltransferase [Saccharopolyspora sp. HNM0983]|uniref:S-adenosyl-L-methionine-dependent methyltransferase n=1 Tax=Saccharopolyspora montiporae TaxID=2781240 RepID=A0A929G178_9PSEU|nr:SAM-dependent methyltransferase [Saccharopolyspora sp. HNM0983]MBE9376044.1 SAM-dependent methyltransferase [Saccharopolyspora sp. HNM0983]
MSSTEQWDIVTSVGLTALGVAAARAVEDTRPDALVHDRFAHAFVEAADPPATMPTSGEDLPNPEWHSVADYLGVRSRFFDDFFAVSADSGIRQFVILAAGLDVRAHRLPWPSGSDVFEVDQPKVLQFKDEVLTGAGATASCARHVVDTDLRGDWTAALASSGFDPDQPTAWLAEGLLPYLPVEAEAELFAAVRELSAPGSRISLECIDAAAGVLDEQTLDLARRQFGIDIRDLFDTRPRTSPQEQLTAAGWRIATDENAATIGEHYGRSFGLDTGARVAQTSRFVIAQRD